MAELTKKERVRAALAGKPVDRVPVSLWGHDFLREWSPEDLVAATLDAYRSHDWDFIKFNPRASYFAEAWGSTYQPPSTQEQPRLISLGVGSVEDLAKLQPVDPRAGVFGEHLTALRLLIDEVGDEVDVVQTIFSPLGVAARLSGDRNDATFLGYASADPTAAHVAVAAITVTLAAYAEAAIEIGAAGIFFAPLWWASHDTASEDFYREFGRPYDLQVLARVREAPFNILHVCRNNNMIDLLLDYPVAAFNWADGGEGNPSLSEIKARTDKAVMGGVDRDLTSAKEAAAQARSALRAGPDRLFVSGGCSIPAETPAETCAAVVAAVR